MVVHDTVVVHVGSLDARTLKKYDTMRARPMKEGRIIGCRD